MVAIDITGNMERVGNNVVGTQYRKSMVILSHFSVVECERIPIRLYVHSGGKVGAGVRL
jgi:hypothetical protein